MKPCVLLLPGAASWIGSEKYRKVCLEMECEARKRGFDPSDVRYPGQDPSNAAEKLSFEGAVRATLEACRNRRPRLIVARSLGCQVVLAAVGRREEWLSTCDGVTLWGPCLNSFYQRMWPTVELRGQEVARYAADYGTIVDLSLFESPALETLIRTADCNLRLVRGTLDECSLTEDLEYLASLHRRFQPHRWREVVEVDGLRHTVLAEEVEPHTASRYFDALFCPVVA